MYRVKVEIYSHQKQDYIPKTFYLESLHDAEMLKSRENEFGMVRSIKRIKATGWLSAFATASNIWEDEGGLD